MSQEKTPARSTLNPVTDPEGFDLAVNMFRQRQEEVTRLPEVTNPPRLVTITTYKS